MRPSRYRALVYLTLVLIIGLGGFVRGVSLITNGPSVLLDLDAFHSLRAVDSIMSNGKVASFDPLSSAPNGTRYTFATSQGYYGFISSLGLVAGLSPSESLAISPVIFFVLELVSLFAISLSFSKSNVAALLAPLFAIGLTGWSAISILGADPVAENLGAAMFLISILQATLLSNRFSYLLIGLLAFLDGITIQAHPITYYFLNLTLVAVTFTIVRQRTWKLAKGLILAMILSLYSFLLFALSGASLGEGETFSQAAYWLASLSPHIYTIDNSTLVAEMGAPTIVLAGVAIIIAIRHRASTIYPLLAWVAVLYSVVLIGEIAVFTPYGRTVESIPFSAPLVLSHRIMPYLPPALCVLAATTIGEFTLPSLISLAKRVRISDKIIGAAVIMIVLAASSSQLYHAYQYSTIYANSFNLEPRYSHLYDWISAHTSNDSIFIANDVSIGVYIKAIDGRPVFFTTSQEDITVTDLIQRASVQTCVFLPICSTNRTISMIQSYHISYAVIVTPALLINQNSSSLVQFSDQGQLANYLTWFRSRPNFAQVYNDSNSFVFSV